MKTNFFNKLFVMVTGLLSSLGVLAAPDYTTLTDSVDFGTTIAAVLVVFAAIAALYLVIRGGKVILASLK